MNFQKSTQNVPCDLNYVSETRSMHLFVSVCIQMKLQSGLCYSYNFDVVL